MKSTFNFIFVVIYVLVHTDSTLRALYSISWITFANGCFTLKVLRCQYKGGRRNNLEGLSANSTIADLQEKIWLLTDVPPHAQRSNYCQLYYFTIIYFMLLVMTFACTWFAPVGHGRCQRCLVPKNKIKKLCLVICVKQKQSKIEAVESGKLWSGQPSVYTEIDLLWTGLWTGKRLRVTTQW